jgi:Arc/MetJ-type ribon-helix-helix transcriptional regulator
LKLITLYLPETYIKALDQLVGAKFFPNRAEAIRAAIRDLIRSEPHVMAAIVRLKEANRARERAAELEASS